MSFSLLPEGFCFIKEHAPALLIDLKYQSQDNLVGRPLKGYPEKSAAVLTHVAVMSLIKIQNHLQQPQIAKALNLIEPTILIYDAFRPQMAADDLWQWSQGTCEQNKANYYPTIDKKDFVDLGYIAKKSSHSRGSTVDMTIVEGYDQQKRALDMGTCFDFMDPLSHPENEAVGKVAYQNRQFLKKLMNDFGWEGIPQEWWHFTYRLEPYNETYFNFPLPSMIR